MSPRSLLFSSDLETSRQITRALQELELGVEACSEIFAALRALTTKTLHVIVIDWDEGLEASFLLKTARESRSNHDVFAIVVGRTDARAALEQAGRTFAQQTAAIRRGATCVVDFRLLHGSAEKLGTTTSRRGSHDEPNSEDRVAIMAGRGAGMAHAGKSRFFDGSFARSADPLELLYLWRRAGGRIGIQKASAQGRREDSPVCPGWPARLGLAERGGRRDLFCRRLCLEPAIERREFRGRERGPCNLAERAGHRPASDGRSPSGGNHFTGSHARRSAMARQSPGRSRSAGAQFSTGARTSHCRDAGADCSTRSAARTGSGCGTVTSSNCGCPQRYYSG